MNTARQTHGRSPYLERLLVARVAGGLRGDVTQSAAVADRVDAHRVPLHASRQHRQVQQLRALTHTHTHTHQRRASRHLHMWHCDTFNYSAPTGKRSIVMSVSVCVCVCPSAIISSELLVRSSPNLLRMLPMAVARSSSGGVVISHVLPVLWMTSYLLISQGCSTSPPSTCSLELGYELCAVIPVAGQRTYGTTFRALKVTSQWQHRGRSLRSMTALFIR